MISGFPLFSKTSFNIWQFMVHILLKAGLKNFEHYFSSMWDECNCAVVWAFFGIAFLRDWNENWPFPVLWHLLSFPNLLAYWVQHFHGIQKYSKTLVQLNFWLIRTSQLKYTLIWTSVLCLVTHWYVTLCDPMDVAHQAPLSIEFSRQEHWSGMSCLSPGNIHDLEIKHRSPGL